jgi:UDP-GlcNAc3NAcA epimerase
MPIKVLTVVGARPQFVKAAAVSRAIRNGFASGINEILVHTGQHFDVNMSKVFFDELDIPAPKYNLAISGGSHGAMTGRMLEGIEEVMLMEKPDWTLIYGDTNSTLAAAVAAAKLHIPVAHVEAGLRSFNMRMPEEINRILADRVSKLLLCPTIAATRNLREEGIIGGVHNVGDVMYDAALYHGEQARRRGDVLQNLALEPGRFALATVHRAENTDDPMRLREIVIALSQASNRLPVVLPLHPRTRQCIQRFGFAHQLEGVRSIDPLPFVEMAALERSAQVIFTDSGGVQKEAYFYGVPCLTLRDETEWVETTDAGANVLVGANSHLLMEWLAKLQNGEWTPNYSATPYGDGNASKKILALIAA